MIAVLRTVVLVCALFFATGATVPDVELRLEGAFLGVPSSQGARESSQIIAQRYHYAGTPGDHRLALYVRDRMRAFGLAAHIESFQSVVYTPKALELQLLSSPAVTFDLHDPAIAVDPRGARSGIGMPFNAGSGNGDVVAQAFDAGNGLDADYARLRGADIDVRGKIALIRYGAEYRGNLAIRAQRSGAVGVIFFSDPKQDKGPAYPNGPYPSYQTVQRGVVTGDDNLPLKIPVVPITARNAYRLIADMKDGVTASRLRERVLMNATKTTLWNTIGEIKGRTPGQSIVLGAHRDAWVYGVTDDGSGISTLLETARGLGRLHRDGWVPKRTIMIAAWDGEEIGELGSAAYVATHRDHLRSGCIAYVNTDESASGPVFGASAAAALASVLVGPVHSVLGIARPEIDGPAGGSDFESFIYTLGTPIVDIGYTGPLGTYHSPYDDYRYASLYADPGFVHHRTIAQTIGVFAMRLAEADRPFRFVPYGAALRSGMREMGVAANKAGLKLDSTRLASAIDRIDEVARRADAATIAQDVPVALQAAQALDLIAYSANGYASIAFPGLASAIATGDQKRLDAALDKAVGALDAASDLIERSNT